MRRALLELSSVLASLGDLVLPASCAGCGRAGPVCTSLCPDCGHALAGAARVRWPDPVPPGLPPPWAVAAYTGPVREVLLAHKEHGRRALTAALGEALGRAAIAAAGGPAAAVGSSVSAVVLVPMPSALSARRRRGGDPLLRMTVVAARAARRRGVLAGVGRLLTQTRRPADQAGLRSVDRFANLAGALRVRPGPWSSLPATARLVLVDDVVTTGATLAEAARALRAVGGCPVGAAVVAATPRVGSSRQTGRPPDRWGRSTGQSPCSATSPR